MWVSWSQLILLHLCLYLSVSLWWFNSFYMATFTGLKWMVNVASDDVWHRKCAQAPTHARDTSALCTNWKDKLKYVTRWTHWYTVCCVLVVVRVTCTACVHTNRTLVSTSAFLRPSLVCLPVWLLCSGNVTRSLYRFHHFSLFKLSNYMPIIYSSLFSSPSSLDTLRLLLRQWITV